MEQKEIISVAQPTNITTSVFVTPKPKCCLMCGEVLKVGDTIVFTVEKHEPVWGGINLEPIHYSCRPLPELKP